MSIAFGKVADGRRWGILHLGARQTDAADAAALTSVRTALKYKATLGVPFFLTGDYDSLVLVLQ